MSGDAPEAGGRQLPTDLQKSVPVPSGPSQVFISYASQDVAVADTIVATLERHGLRCWIAPRDVVPGESYAGAIVHAIDATKLIVLVLSEHGAASQHVLREVERASSKRHPVVAFRINLAPMPVDLEYFLNSSQWLDASASGVDSALPKLVDAVRRILAPSTTAPSDPTDTSRPITDPSASRRVGAQSNRRLSQALIALGALIAIALGYFLVNRFWLAQRAAPMKPVVASAPATPSFKPAPHSIAVLPFVNMSGDKEQEYFSDGLTEEILNSLARINELQVAARTSAFSFKGKDTDIATIARKLNVGAVLEGSVRRSTHTVRITAQLINAVTGFHLWSQTYDRDLGDVLKLQTDIANAVASALKVSLLGDVATKIELGGTRNPAAFDAYLRGSKAFAAAHDAKGFQTAIAALTDAVHLDPSYALAFALRSSTFTKYGIDIAMGQAARAASDSAQTDAQRAIALAPELAEAHLALADFFWGGSLDFTRALQEYERALALAPGNVRVLQQYAYFASRIGRSDAAIAAAQHAVVLDPLDPHSHWTLSQVLYGARHYQPALAAADSAIALDPDDPVNYGDRGLADYALGNLQGARASCEIKPDEWGNQMCLATTYDKLGRHADAEAVFAKLKASLGDDGAYQYAEIYTQWGDAPKALEWLETALRLRDPGLADLKVDALLDPLRQMPRFQAVERALKFPT